MKKKKVKITKKMKLQELLQFPEAVEILMSKGISCLGCPMAMMETLEQGCEAHGLNPDKIVDELNKKLRKK